MPRRTQLKGGPHPVDVHIGQRLRMCRTLLGLNQKKVAEALGLTFQQVQKYETGSDQVSARRLSELCQILDVPVSFFFEEMPTNRKNHNRATDNKSETTPDPINKRETLEFVRAYHRIKDPAIRGSIAALTKAIAG